MKNISLVLLLTLLLLGVLELVVSLTQRGEHELIDPRMLADVYNGSEWVEEYYREFWDSSVDWESYTYWKYKPRNGLYINIDKKGRRYTEQIYSSAEENKPVRVFLFGGSTMFGTGSRDRYTIPSLLAHELDKRGIAAEVTNFGQSGYVSTQEVISLIRELQQGNIPDIVLFYDGVNDVYSAFQNGRAGLPQNERNRRTEFRASQDLSVAFKNMVSALARRSALISRLTRDTGSDLASNDADTPPDTGALAKHVVTTYLNNLKTVDALAGEHHFRVGYFWQPVIFGKNKLSPYEMKERDRQSDTGDLYRAVYAEIDKITFRENLYNLSHIFSDLAEPVYIDYCHTSEAGNAQIASAMVDSTIADFRAITDPPSDTHLVHKSTSIRQIEPGLFSQGNSAGQ